MFHFGVFSNHGCSAELQELSTRLSSLLTDLDKPTKSDPELLGTTTEIRKEIFNSVGMGYSVLSGKK